MRVIETLGQLGARLQVALIVCGYPEEGSGELSVIYANPPALLLFGATSLDGVDVKSLMPPAVAANHSANVKGYTERSKRDGETATRQSSLMGKWRSLEGLRRDGTLVPLEANVADIRNSTERYFVAIFRDRTEQVKREEELASAKARAESATLEAEEARELAEASLVQERRLSAQVTLLERIFRSTVALIAMLGVLILASWITGSKDSKDALAMVERVLLVLCGILGSAVAAVFDSRPRDTRE